MKKRKKKQKQSTREQEDRAHHRNEFFRRLRGLSVSMGVYDVLKKYSNDDLNIMYLTRCQSLKVVVAPGSNVPKDVIETARAVASYSTRKIKIPVLPDGSVEVNLYDYFTIYLTLMLYLTIYKDKKDVRYKPLYDACTPYMDYIEQTHQLASNRISVVSVGLMLHENDLRKKLYIFVIKSANENSDENSLITNLEIISDTPEKRDFIIDGIQRPAYRMGGGDPKNRNGITYVNFPAEKLELNFHIKNLQLPVYIQSHAIERLMERLDLVKPGAIYFNLFASLHFYLNFVRNKNGILLLEMHLLRAKVGYLVADIVEGCVVIRTFLFLTNSGTPESDKLSELTGLEKEDKSYLEIDKLSTFCNSDIPKNDKLKDIFNKAGCGSLFEIEGMKEAFMEQGDSAGTKSKAQQVIEYLGLDKVPADDEIDNNDELPEDELNDER